MANNHIEDDWSETYSNVSEDWFEAYERLFGAEIEDLYRPREPEPEDPEPAPKKIKVTWIDGVYRPPNRRREPEQPIDILEIANLDKHHRIHQLRLHGASEEDPMVLD